MKFVANNMPLLVGAVLVLGLLSVGKAKKLDDIAVEDFEEERYRDIIHLAPDQIGIDPKDAYEAEMRLANTEIFANVDGGGGDATENVAGDVPGRRMKALMDISDISTPDAIADGTGRNLGGRKSESKRKKSLFKKKSSSKSKNSKSSESKSKKKSQKKSSSSSTDDKSMKRKKKSDSSTEDDSKSKSKKDKKSDSDSDSSKSKKKSTKKSDSDSSTESKSKKKKDKKSTKDSKDSKVSCFFAYTDLLLLLHLHAVFVQLDYHMVRSDISQIKYLYLFLFPSYLAE